MFKLCTRSFRNTPYNNNNILTTWFDAQKEKRKIAIENEKEELKIAKENEKKLDSYSDYVLDNYFEICYNSTNVTEITERQRLSYIKMIDMCEKLDEINKKCSEIQIQQDKIKSDIKLMQKQIDHNQNQNQK